ncbi:MAG: hypothetical protein IKO26_06570 [Paludibacteraceae bacterium]|nr:hypothetical protein [Paludibacteraceae bacterium]
MKKNTLIILITLIAIVIVAAGLLTPHAIEMYTFHKVGHEQTVGVCDDYLKKYPDGRYLEEVLRIKIFASKDSQTTINTIDLYLERFPDDENCILFDDYKKYLLSNPDARTIDDYKRYINSETK